MAAQVNDLQQSNQYILTISEHSSDSDKRCNNNKCTYLLKTNLLSLLTIAGVFLGIILGFVLKYSKDEWTQRDISYVQFIGDVFLRMLKGLILPLIISSLVAAIGSLDMSLSGKIGGRAITYYMATTICAVILGIILVTAIQPGSNNNAEINQSNSTQKEQRVVTTVDTLLDLIRNMFAPNLIQACIEQYRTVIVTGSNKNITDINRLPMKSEYVDGTNILGLVVFSVFLGVAIGKTGPVGKPVQKFFNSFSEIMMVITRWVIWTSPIGIMFLIAAKVLEIEDFKKTMEQLGMYFSTVTIGLIIHGFIILPLIFFVITKKKPFMYMLNMGQALATAFGTSSSSATLPSAISCLEEKNHIDSRVARFVMPIGATINMDGTALYEAVAAIFIAQMTNTYLSFGSIVAVCITATFASIGAAGIPQAGLVTMVMVLDTIGLPPESVSLIIAIDWILDRFRTCINVLGDSLGAGIINHLSKNELEKLPTTLTDATKEEISNNN